MHIHIHVYIYIHTSGSRPSAIRILEKKLADKDAQLVERDGDILRLKAEVTALQHQLEAALAAEKKRTYVHLQGAAAKKVAAANTSAKKAKTTADAKVSKVKEVASKGIAKAGADAAAAISAVEIAADAKATISVAKVTGQAAAAVAAAEGLKQVAELELEKVEKDMKAYSRGDLSQLSRTGRELMEVMEESGFGAEMSTLRDETHANKAEMVVLNNQIGKLSADVEKQKKLKNGHASLKRAAESDFSKERLKVQKQGKQIQDLQV
jgi:hypothetical protein